MRARAFAVNSAGMVGHTPLRMFVMGDDAWERPASEPERVAMAALLAECLRDGAFGLTTSHFDHDRANRPVPSSLADDAEARCAHRRARGTRPLPRVHPRPAQRRPR